jgi:hypothetical protein
MDYKKCSTCKCFRKYDEYEERRCGGYFKTCKSCRMSQKIKKNGIELDENGFAIEEPKNKGKITKVLPNDLKKCFKCRRFFAPIGKAYESVEYLTCLICRTGGNHLHLDDIDISHEIYPEKPKNKMPVWTPDSESD